MAYLGTLVSGGGGSSKPEPVIKKMWMTTEFLVRWIIDKQLVRATAGGSGTCARSRLTRLSARARLAGSWRSCCDPRTRTSSSSAAPRHP
jgi:hypothetical protein